jgi:hypothetical protein
MLSNLILGSDKILWVIPKTLWFAVLIILCIILIIMYVKYRKQMRS